MESQSNYKFVNQEFVRNGKKIKGSVFLITINTNQTPNENSQLIIDELEQKLFSKENVVKFLCNYNFGKRVPADIEDIYTVEVKSAVELSSKKRELHIHYKIRVAHTINLQINIPLVKTVVYKFSSAKLYGEDQKNKKPYIHIKGLSDADINFDEYLLKQENMEKSNLRFVK